MQDPVLLLERERIAREKQNTVLKILAPIFVAALAFSFTFYYKESCALICPSHMKPPTSSSSSSSSSSSRHHRPQPPRRAEIDLDQLLFPARWMYKYLYLYPPLCQLGCPFRRGYKRKDTKSATKSKSMSLEERESAVVDDGYEQKDEGEDVVAAVGVRSGGGGDGHHRRSRKSGGGDDTQGEGTTKSNTNNDGGGDASAASADDDFDDSNDPDAIARQEQNIQLHDLLTTLPQANKSLWVSKGVTVYEHIFLEHGWQLVDDIDEARVVYFVRRKHARQMVNQYYSSSSSSYQQQTTMESLFPTQAVNYVHGSAVITEKYRLQQTLRAYAKTLSSTTTTTAPASEKKGVESNSNSKNGKVALQLQPRTVLLNDARECNEFFADQNNYKYVWLIKASALSRGEGIQIYDDLNKAKSRFVDPVTGKCFVSSSSSSADEKEKHHQHQQQEELIAQRYVMNPLLLDGKKMELRSYWLIASVDPFIALYHDGTVRRATSDWKSGNWDDPLLHICNTFQQKKADPSGYESKKDERKWTVPQLEEYLVKTRKHPKAKPGWWNSTMKKQLKTILSIVIKASMSHMKGEYQQQEEGTTTATTTTTTTTPASLPSPPFAFSLMGMDCMLDDDLRPWLTEIQTGPGLSMDDATKRALIGPMVTEAMNIVLEVHYRKQRGLSLASLESTERFEMVYNEVSGFDADVFGAAAPPPSPSSSSSSSSTRSAPSSDRQHPNDV